MQKRLRRFLTRICGDSTMSFPYISRSVLQPLSPDSSLEFSVRLQRDRERERERVHLIADLYKTDMDILEGK